MKKLILPIILILGITMILGFVSASDCKGYTCSPWSVCDNNLKTRTCEEVIIQGENCGITTKPAESLPCDIMESNLVCKDSDTIEEFNPTGIYGQEDYKKGHLVNSNQNADYWDTCTDLQTADANLGWAPTSEGKILMEYYCNGNNYQYRAFDCPLGCKDGACINPCVDKDNGNDYYTKGMAYVDYTGKNNIPGESKFTTDFCENENQLREYNCKEGSVGVSSEVYWCPFGCQEGACLKIKPEEQSAPIDLLQKIDEIKNETVKEAIKKETDISYLCSGCVLDKKCYPFGFRKDKNYCDDKSSTFIVQQISDTACENNFQCDSNLCIDNKCVSGSVWAKFMRWFSRLFGGN